MHISILIARGRGAPPGNKITKTVPWGRNYTEKSIDLRKLDKSNVTASCVIFLFHRVIIEEYSIQIVPYRKNKCENHTFYHTTNAYNFCEVPVIV